VASHSEWVSSGLLMLIGQVFPDQGAPSLAKAPARVCACCAQRVPERV